MPKFGVYHFGTMDLPFWHTPDDTFDKLNKSSVIRDASCMLKLACYYIETEQLPADFHRVQWKEEHTKFFNDSWELHERYARTVHGRHCDNCEQMARAFECYVADKLEQEGNQSQYLTAHSEDVVFVRENGEQVYGGPMGEERDEIGRMFDVVFKELKKMGILQQGESERNYR